MDGAAFDPGRRRRAILFLAAVVLLNSLAAGIVIPVLPGLVRTLTGGSDAQAAAWLGGFGALFAGMQMFGQPLLGGLSDRFGRRPVLLLALAALGFDYVLMAWAPAVGWLAVGRVVTGLASSSSASAGAYVADVAAPDDRPAAFGQLAAAAGAGFIAGPGLGGLLGMADTRAPFWAAAALCLGAAAIGLWLLPESLPRERRSPVRLTVANPVGALRLYRASGLGALALVLFLYWMSSQVVTACWVLYGHARYSWGPGWTGASLVVVGVGAVLVSMLAVKPAVARLGERGAMLVGLAAGAAGLVAMGLASSGWLFLAAIPVSWLLDLFGPGFQGLMTRRARPDEQGRLQGANGAVASLAGILGPPLFAAIYAASVAWAPGLAFLVSGAVMAAALAVGWLATRGAS